MGTEASKEEFVRCLAIDQHEIGPYVAITVAGFVACEGVISRVCRERLIVCQEIKHGGQVSKDGAAVLAVKKAF